MRGALRCCGGCWRGSGWRWPAARALGWQGCWGCGRAAAACCGSFGRCPSARSRPWRCWAWMTSRCAAGRCRILCVRRRPDEAAGEDLPAGRERSVTEVLNGSAEFDGVAVEGPPARDAAEVAAAARLAGVFAPEAIDRLLADAAETGTPLDGQDGLINQLTRAVIERALGAELDDHLGYVKGDPAGNGSPNSRNGSYPKTVTTSSGPVRIAVPRDRNGEFAPKIVPKGARRLGQVDDMILSLYARGMTTRDITAHLAEVYGAEVSPVLVSRVTDVVAEEITAWATRPLDAVYPIVYIDAVVLKIRDGGTVDNRAAHLVIGVDVDGFKHVLGIWIQEHEGAKFWLSVLTELRNRGMRDALIVCCDGLAGLPEAIETVWPEAIVQTCVVHLIRASMRFVSYGDRKKITAALRPIYTAVNEAAAKAALEQ